MLPRISGSVNSPATSFNSSLASPTVGKGEHCAITAISALLARSMNYPAASDGEFDLKGLNAIEKEEITNLFNLPRSLEELKFGTGKEETLEELEKLEKLKGRVKQFLEADKAALPASVNVARLRSHEKAEAEFAAEIHNSPEAKKFFIAFGQSITQFFKIYYGKEATEKLNEAFVFKRTNQAGAVSVDNQPFLKFHDTPQDMLNMPLRVLGSPIAQVAATDESQKLILRPLITIKTDPAERKKYAHLIDMDFLCGLSKTCTLNEEGLPAIDDERLKLYTEEYGQGADSIGIRIGVADGGFKKYSFSELKNLTKEERDFIIEDQALPKDIKDDEKKIIIKSGAQVFRLTPDTKFLRGIQENNWPAVAGESGTAFNLAIVAKLLAPGLRKNLSQLGVELKTEKDYCMLLSTTLMGYLHGLSPVEKHHSMREVRQALESADQFIAKTYTNKENSESPCFGFKEINEEFEAQFIKSALNKALQ